MSAKRRFTTADAATAPTADESARPASSGDRRSAFTWRLTPDQERRFATLGIDLRSEVGRHISRGDVLDALVQLATDDATVRRLLIARLAH